MINRLSLTAATTIGSRFRSPTHIKSFIQDLSVARQRLVEVFDGILELVKEL